jgi:RNase P/RNase MRP subunit POP5
MLAMALQLPAKAQLPVVRAVTDKNQVLIGEQFTLLVETILSNGYDISPALLPDSMEHFEVIKQLPADSVFTQGTLSSIKQQFVLTSFDSGKWHLPAAKINVSPKGKNAGTSFYTDSFTITVAFSVSDTSTQIRDIKPVKEAVVNTNYWYWVLAAIGAIMLLLLVWWLIKKKSKPQGILQATLSPVEEAMAALQQLKHTDLSDATFIKSYHTSLSSILKRYLSRKDNQFYFHKTTSDLLVLLDDKKINRPTLVKVAASLRCGDAVKFARYLPPPAESELSLQYIQEVMMAVEKISDSPVNNSH